MKYVFRRKSVKVHNLNRGDSCLKSRLAGNSVAEHGLGKLIPSGGLLFCLDCCKNVK